jgi:hypothetical protein
MNKWRFLLGFGSETGQSKSIAQGLVDIAREQHQILTEVYELDEVDKQVRILIFNMINKTISIIV